MKKRGQLTLFTLIATGILIFVVISLFIFFNIQTTINTTNRGTSFDLEIKEIRNFISSCLERSLRRALTELYENGAAGEGEEIDNFVIRYIPERHRYVNRLGSGVVVEHYIGYLTGRTRAHLIGCLEGYESSIESTEGISANLELRNIETGIQDKIVNVSATIMVLSEKEEFRSMMLEFKNDVKSELRGIHSQVNRIVHGEIEKLDRGLSSTPPIIRLLSADTEVYNNLGDFVVVFDGTGDNICVRTYRIRDNELGLDFTFIVDASGIQSDPNYDEDNDNHLRIIGGENWIGVCRLGDDCDDNPSDDLQICIDARSSGTLNCDDGQYSVCAECIHPGAREVCNGNVDNNCDGNTNEGLTCSEEE